MMQNAKNIVPNLSHVKNNCYCGITIVLSEIFYYMVEYSSLQFQMLRLRTGGSSLKSEEWDFIPDCYTMLYTVFFRESLTTPINRQISSSSGVRIHFL